MRTSQGFGAATGVGSKNKPVEQEKQQEETTEEKESE